MTQIKTKGDAKGWEVQVRITANDITIISFGVETLKTVGMTAHIKVHSPVFRYRRQLKLPIVNHFSAKVLSLSYL